MASATLKSILLAAAGAALFGAASRPPDVPFRIRMLDPGASETCALADVNRDYMAHNGRDPGEREPLGVYWYEDRSGPDHKVGWVRHIADYGSRAGGGMQIAAADLDGDGDIDLVCPGKSGLFLFENLGQAKPPVPRRRVK